MIVEALGEHGLTEREDAEVRVIIEKPFGTTLAGGPRAQPDACSAVLDEPQVFRIDHYLGKETVQNMLAFRFANGMFEPLWNRNYIDNVQITAAEDIGIGSRAGYYDNAGALRDLMQNHMLQLLCAAVHGAARRLLRRRGPQREGQGAARDPPAGARRDRARAVRGRHRRAARRCRATSTRTASREDSITETYAALRLHVRTGAGPASRSTCAPASACRARSPRSR